VHTSQLWSERRKSLEISLRRLEPGRSVLAIEVGTWFAAGSTEVIARSLPAGSRLFCIDLWKPYVNPEESVSSAKNMNEVSLIAHLSAIKNIRRIEKKYPSIEISILQGKSEELLNLFESGSADFIYLDGSHYYKDFKLDLEIASKILNPATGVLCGDDCELEPNLDLYEKCKPYENLDLVRLPSGEWVHPGVVIALFESGFRVRVRGGHWMRI
jgi:Methyltransferase domain